MELWALVAENCEDYFLIGVFTSLDLASQAFEAWTKIDDWQYFGAPFYYNHAKVLSIGANQVLKTNNSSLDWSRDTNTNHWMRTK